MKKLTKMKLINWHRFSDITIDFGNATLLSGENGAGKSTLLDAIQFVVTCSTNYFNKAAHENGKRKLTGYIRCKTGREKRPYEREGEISAHIALEFYEESRKQYFIIGAVIDSATEGQETTVRYLIDDQKLNDELFLNDKTPKSITEFRTSNKKIKQWCKTQTEAKKVIKSRFGRIEDKFFRLIPKALAFEPINDIKDFVYSYILDEKEVNIDILRENVRTYQDLEKTLANIKKRIEKLEQIEKHHGEVMDCLKSNQMYEYFHVQAESDITKANIEKTIAEIKHEEYRGKEEQERRNALTKERDEKQEIETALRVEMKQNEDFLALEEQQKHLVQLQKEEEEYLQEMRALRQSIRSALEHVRVLVADKDAASDIAEYQKMLSEAENLESVSDGKALTEKVIRYKEEMREVIRTQSLELQMELENQYKERRELDYRIEQLSKKRLSYNENVNRLLEAIKEEFLRIGRRPEPRILCELLEIADENWRNAVEGYLNTQRFYILVEPENFDIALGIYDKMRRAGKVYGVGLINTQKMDQYDTAPEGTLARVVTSKNIYARRFINMVLGKVQMCERYDELKHYPTSITKECMKYQNRVASAIKPNIYEVPFIGSNAFKVQLMQAKIQKKELEQEITAGEKEKERMHSNLLPLDTEADMDIKYRLETISKLRSIQSTIKSCHENIKTLKQNATFILKQRQLEELEKIRQNLDKEIGRSNEESGRIKNKIEVKKETLAEYQNQQSSLQSALTQVAEEGKESLGLWQKEYQKQLQQKTLEQFKENFDRRQKANNTNREKAEEKMRTVMIAYKMEHDFGAAASMEGYPEFALVYERLRTSELLKYEEKVQSAKQAAEEEFREQFLAKLQENMKQAQNEFKELNKALKGISFSNEKYEFMHMPSKRYRSYYEMIMDDFNAVQGESILSGHFHETHKAVIDELFERLALDSENEVQALNEFTDYRAYMDYDIRIIHSDDTYSFYSKVCEEKSGGETQTPFYVTIAASFVQLYSNNIGGEAIGLVMFDEAFNNMDDERIGGVLEFLQRLPLQIIISSPPDKIQYIGPVVDETLLLMTDEKVNYIEEYYNGAI